MQVTKTLDYAVRSLIYMGHQPVEKHSMKEISQEQHIPLNYLAKIMRRLVKKGLLDIDKGIDAYLDKDTCPKLPEWERIKVSMIKILEDTTLEDMLKERKNVTMNQVN